MLSLSQGEEGYGLDGLMGYDERYDEGYDDIFFLLRCKPRDLLEVCQECNLSPADTKTFCTGMKWLQSRSAAAHEQIEREAKDGSGQHGPHLGQERMEDVPSQAKAEAIILKAMHKEITRNHDELVAETNFIDCGLDSSGVVNVALALKEEFGMEVRPSVILSTQPSAIETNAFG